jgi:branched-chain amino acid transport system ATP-binding protein
MLEVKSLMVFYENAIAINNVNLVARQGEITGVFGANSAGKSTLMYTISGIMLDVKKKEEMRGGERITLLGTIAFEKWDVTQMKASERARRGIILCPERKRIFPESTALENLKVGGYLATKAQAKRTMEYVFTIFPPLENLKEREGGFLSGGEQQMLAIGRSLMAQPKLLLLDEPLLGLSPLMEAMLARTIRDINHQTGITIMISEQYARPIAPIVHYAYVLENGAAVLEGTSQELMDNPDVKSAYFGW